MDGCGAIDGWYVDDVTVSACNTKKADKLTLKIVDFTGRTVQELKATKEPGLHHISWDLTSRPGGLLGNLFGIFGGPSGGRGQPQIMRAPTGMYRVVLTVDGDEQTQPLRLESDPTIPPALAAEGDEQPETPGEEEQSPARREDD